MRPIKFRAWYHKQIRNNVVRINDGLYWDNGDFDIFAFSDNLTALMQFTGLHDKNGTEIYEGDIIDTPSDKPLTIEWNEKYASFCLNRCGWMHPHYFGEAVDPNDCAVVGNIYENPNMAGIINRTEPKEDLEWGETIQ